MIADPNKPYLGFWVFCPKFRCCCKRGFADGVSFGHNINGNNLAGVVCLDLVSNFLVDFVAALRGCLSTEYRGSCEDMV